MRTRGKRLLIIILIVFIAGLLLILGILLGALLPNRNQLVINSCEPYGSLLYSVCGEETDYCPMQIRMDYHMYFKEELAFINGVAISEGETFEKDGVILATVVKIRKPKITLELTENVAHVRYSYQVIPRGK